MSTSIPISDSIANQMLHTVQVYPHAHLLLAEFFFKDFQTCISLHFIF